MADEEIEIPVLVKTPQAPDGTVAGVGRFAQVFQRAFGAIKNHPYVVAAIVLAKSAYEAVRMWGEQQRAVNSLNQALINQGIYSRELSAQYQAMASAFGKGTQFGDEEVLAAQASMQRYLGGKQISERLMRAVVDFAAGQKMSLVQAAELVGRSIGTGTNALVRYGVQLDANMPQEEKLAAVIGALESKWKGQAEAGVQGLGAISQMKNSLQTLMETIGRSLEPFVVQAAQAIAQFATSLATSRNYVDGMAAAFDELAVGVLVVKATVVTALKSIPVVLSSRLGAVVEVLKGNLTRAGEVYSDGNKRLTQIALQQKKKSDRARQEVLEVRATAEQVKADQLEFMLRESIRTRRTNRDRAQPKMDEIFKARSEKEIFEAQARQLLRTDEKFRKVNEAIRHEKDITKLRELELQKRAIKEDAIRKAQMSFQEKTNILGAISDKEQIALHRPVLDQLADARNSKFGPQILIGKGAAVAQIILNTNLAIAGATEALAAIPPPVGEALAVATANFLAMYGAEQVENIINSSIDLPGRIGGIPFTYEALLESVWGYLGRQIGQIGQMVGAVYGFTGDLVSGAGRAINDALSRLGPIGSVLGTIASTVANVYGFVYNAVGDAVQFVYGTISGVIGDIVSTIAGAVAGVVGSIVDGIGSALDSVFGWLFAEGGVVSHAGAAPVVTPLDKSGLQMHSTINVTILGGLIPTVAEARRLAAEVAKEL